MTDTVETAAPVVRARKKSEQQVFLVALGHLGLTQSKSDVSSWLAGRVEVDVPDHPTLEHRWCKAEGFMTGDYCDCEEDGAYPVTVLVV